MIFLLFQIHETYLEVFNFVGNFNLNKKIEYRIIYIINTYFEEIGIIYCKFQNIYRNTVEGVTYITGK